MLKLVAVLAALGLAGATNPCGSLGEGQLFAINPRGCSWFWFCPVGEDPAEGKCPDSLHFDMQTQSCTYKHAVSPPCTFDDAISEQANLQCPRNDDFRLLPHPFACDKFTMCWQGKSRDFSCPPDRPHFSIFDNDCTSEFLADCRAVERFCASSPLGQFQTNPRGCDDYLLCTECSDQFELLHWTCPQGFRFSDALKICVPELGFQCHVDEHPDFVAPPEPFAIDCATSSADAPRLRPHPSDCEHYFFCESPAARSILFRCGEGLKFSVATNKCELAANAVCFADGGRRTFERVFSKVTRALPPLEVA